jgi:hypothetical protein
MKHFASARAIFFLAALPLFACQSKSSGDATAAPAVSSWPVLPADPPDANAPADEDPAVANYEQRTGHSLEPHFSVCINHELSKAPKLQGSVTMVVDVRADGSAVSAHPTLLQGLNAEVVKCFVQAIVGSHFRPPPTGAVQIRVPFTLTASQ